MTGLSSGHSCPTTTGAGQAPRFLLDLCLFQVQKMVNHHEVAYLSTCIPSSLWRLEDVFSFSLRGRVAQWRLWNSSNACTGPLYEEQFNSSWTPNAILLMKQVPFVTSATRSVWSFTKNTICSCNHQSCMQGQPLARHTSQCLNELVEKFRWHILNLMGSKLRSPASTMCSENRTGYLLLPQTWQQKELYAAMLFLNPRLTIFWNSWPHLYTFSNRPNLPNILLQLPDRLHGQLELQMTAFIQGGESQPLEACWKLRSGQQPSRPASRAWNAKQFQAVPSTWLWTGRHRVALIHKRWSSERHNHDEHVQIWVRWIQRMSSSIQSWESNENMMLLGRHIQGPV